MLSCASWRSPGGGHGNPLQRTWWTEEPAGLQSIGLQRFRHDWSNLAHMRACLLIRVTENTSFFKIFLLKIYNFNLNVRKYDKFKLRKILQNTWSVLFKKSQGREKQRLKNFSKLLKLTRQQVNTKWETGLDSEPARGP